MDVSTIISWLTQALTTLGWFLLSVIIAVVVFALLAFFFIRRWLLALRSRYTGRDGFIGQVALPLLGAILWFTGFGGQTRDETRKDPESPKNPEVPPRAKVERTIHDV